MKMKLAALVLLAGTLVMAQDKPPIISAEHRGDLFKAQVKPATTAPRNEAVISGFVNFGPWYPVTIGHGYQTFLGGEATKAGGSAEYRRYFQPHFATGVLYEQNPSEGRLCPAQGPTESNICTPESVNPMMRYILVSPLTARTGVGAWNFLLQTGPALEITDGYSNSGISPGFEWMFGGGIQAPLASRWFIETGFSGFVQKNGCYGDPACNAYLSVAHDVKAGFGYRF